MKILNIKWSHIIVVIVMILFITKLIFEYLFMIHHQLDINDFKIGLTENDPYVFSQQPRNPEWEQMDKHTFFRRSAAYYFIDKRLLRIFYITSANNVPKFEIILILHFKNKKSYTVELNNSSSKRHDQWDKYRASSLNYDMSIFDSFKIDINQLYHQGQLIKMSIIIRDDLLKTSTTLTPIDIKIKYLRTQRNMKREGSMICSKCYYYKDAMTYMHFEWWIELNKKIGYNKITFCNSTIPNSFEYRNLFTQYKDLIYIYQMQFLPNLINKHELNDTHNDYLTSFFELKRKQVFYKPITRVFDNIIFNECYLDNVDKYRFITIIDNDETILPRINSKILQHSHNYKLFNKLDHNNKITLTRVASDLEKKCLNKFDTNDSNLFEVYVNKFKKRNNYYSEKSLYFRMGIYLKNSLVENIFNTIENIDSSNLTFNLKYNDDEESDIRFIKRNLVFKISNEEELNYIRVLSKLYRILIKEYENKNKKSLEKYSNRFNRFFYVAGESTFKHFGKTIHSTDSTLQMIHHYPVDSPYYLVRYDMGHVSHFRDSYEFNQKFFPIPIKDIFIDLNYFYCFYKPIISKLEANLK